MASFPPPPWIGTDESGKGDYFGPLVVAGVYADAGQARQLTASGVKDSKLLTDDKAISIAASIVKICHGAYSVLELKPETYNRLYGQFKADKKNLNHMMGWAHSTVIKDLLMRHPSPTVITDKFGDEKFLLANITDEMKAKDRVFIQQPRAEANIAVAAASILARAKFLKWMEEAREKWGMIIPKGATVVINPAREFVAKHGKESLVQVAKLHFCTTDEI